MSTLFAFPYYGAKCLGFIAGAKYQHLYNYAFVAFVIIGSVSNLRVIIGLVDIAFALMAFPNRNFCPATVAPFKTGSNQVFFRIKENRLKGSHS